MSERSDSLKYEFVKRRLYDNYIERTQRKFDKLLVNLANLESWINDSIDRLETLEAKVEGLEMSSSSNTVTLAGRKEALRRKD